MKRTEMINELTQITVVAAPTAETIDMGLQYDYITANGAGTSLGVMSSWPVYKLNVIGVDQWKAIRENIRTQTIMKSDFDGTDIEKLIIKMHSIYGDQFKKYYSDTASIFDDLLTLPEELDVDFYCILDIYVPGEKPVFFADKKELQAAFVEKYCIDIINWEEMSDEEISAWTKRLEEDLTELLINEL